MVNIDNEKSVVRILEILLIQLGYSHINNEIEYEKYIKFGNRNKMFADIVVNLNSKPILVIEAKAPDVKDLNKALQQGISYALQLRARFVLVANGDDFELFDVNREKIISKGSLYEKNLVFFNKTNMMSYMENYNELNNDVYFPCYQLINNQNELLDDNTWHDFIDYGDMFLKWKNQIHFLKVRILDLQRNISEQYIKDEDEKINMIANLKKELDNEISELKNQLNNKENQLIKLNNEKEELKTKLEGNLNKLKFYQENLKQLNLEISKSQKIKLDDNKEKDYLKEIINKSMNKIAKLSKQRKYLFIIIIILILILLILI
jgi:hypothetical protein